MQWIAETVTKALCLTTALSSADKSSGSALIPPVTTPQQATTFAIIYGRPLLSYSHLASKIAENIGFQTNAFYHQQQLANATFNDINRPNLDTLYSEALVDLSSQDIIVTIPEVPSGRFYVFPIYDIYGNNIVNIGTAGVSSTPGSYLLSHRVAKPGYESGSSGDAYTGYIYLPTPYGAIDLRIQVNGSDSEDVTKVHDLQKNFTLAFGPSRPQRVPPLTKSLLFDDLSTDRTEKLLQLTARLSRFNLPEVGSDIAWVTSTLRVAGLSGGSYTTPSEVNLTLAMVDAVTDIASVFGTQFDTYFRELGKDSSWFMLKYRYSGDFKSHYTARAFVAAQGYLQLKANQAIYPVYKNPSGFTSDNSYTITFSGKPPVTGFWSLTVYNETAYLIPNKWNIFSLGDRSAIEYPNGTLVYPGPTSGLSDNDGEFTILLQSLDIPPPDKYLSNWIPTPTRNGKEITKRFNFNLRWYGPTKDLVDGTYVYPTIKTISPVL